MKKKNENPSKYQHVINQLLTLYFSGVYITSKDIMVMGNALGFELPSKNREILLKTLFAECEKMEKMPQLCDGFIRLLQARLHEYKTLTSTFKSIHGISGLWIQRINTLIRLLQQQKRGNPYEQL
jgi:hypothetical protein